MSERHQAIAQALFPQLARIGRATGSPARLQLLNLLMQAPRTVEVLADMTGLSMANASQHLQALKRVHLVVADRQGSHVEYRLASDDVARFYVLLCTLASRQLPELDRVQRDLVKDDGTPDPADLADALRVMRSGKATLLDVRPTEEFDAGHLAGALSIPLAELPQRVGELPRQREVVAYCRGPFCVMASEAAALLKARGLRARAVDLGVVELVDRGLRVVRPARSSRTHAAAPPRMESAATRTRKSPAGAVSRKPRSKA